MPKIIKFTLSDYLKKEEEYLEMSEMLEKRATEIASDIEKIKMPYVVDSVDIYEENCKFMARAIFYNMFDPDDIKSFDFDATWLFTDDHLSKLPPEDFRKRRFEHDFEEFMRLKAEHAKNA